MHKKIEALCYTALHSWTFKRVPLLKYTVSVLAELGSVAGPVIQANGRLTFEDDLRSGGLLYFTTQ